MKTLKNKHNYLTVIDRSLENSQDLVGFIGSNSSYKILLDFSVGSFQNKIDEISNKLNYLDGVTLATTSSNNLVNDFKINGAKPDHVWHGNLANIKDVFSKELGPHSVLKWSNPSSKKETYAKKEVDLKSKFKTKEDYEAYLTKIKSDTSSKKETYAKKEVDLKSKFKTKEDYEAYLTKIKSDTSSKKETYAKKEVDLKSKFKTKEEYESYKSSITIEKDHVGFWKPNLGKKKLMKDFKVKLKDHEGKDVLGDYTVGKDGKIDLSDLPTGKYYGKLSPFNNKEMSEKIIKSIDTQDMILMAKYIGGFKSFNSSEKIAADIDKSGKSKDIVDIQDMMALARIIGGYEEKTGEVELRCASKLQDNKSDDFFEIREGMDNSFQSIILGDVDGSFSQNLI